MTISEAMSKKILKICAEKKITINKLASISLLTQSTIQNIVDGNSKNPKLLTIIRICDGLGITLEEFFKDELFLNIDREDWLTIFFFLFIINYVRLIFHG